MEEAALVTVFQPLLPASAIVLPIFLRPFQALLPKLAAPPIILSLKLLPLLANQSNAPDTLCLTLSAL